MKTNSRGCLLLSEVSRVLFKSNKNTFGSAVLYKNGGHHGRQGGWIIQRFTEFLASSSFRGKTVAAVSDVKSLLSLSTENSSAAPNVAIAPCSAAHDAEADADICSSPC